MSTFLKSRLARLESHLKAENPALLEVLPTYYKFDKLLYKTGLLDRETSLASRISWWPLISVLGTFSSGKSTFINSYVGDDLQSTGNQAVDDKFTVICHRSADGGGNQTLPGSALDADPRFPFYRISHEIEKVAQGEGKHIESYLQLRTTDKEAIRGKMIIDSPGFDADDQRTSTLRITDHILDLSDLVLVFFDARHPEPGAMQDTLEHLVARTVTRTDASKFLYVLNQIDTAAKDDNPEEVVGAWQRAIAQAGLTAGQFYTIYNEKAASPIEDKALRERFRAKRDADLAKIKERM
ncbi:MAG TPA: dynamin family protein, partial [Rhodobacteraceae bacterium]|nr:dynamin family protein [Paracoccaceae bacterium]